MDAFDLVAHRIYRRADIHRRWKGQAQGGISTPTIIPAVFAFSGPSGARFGYDKDEGWRADGTFEFTGEGQRGPMRMIRGNRAILDHAVDGKDLHLFIQTPRQRDRTVEYVGPMVCIGYRLSQAPDDDNKMRETIVFRLAPLQAVQLGADAEAAQTDIEADDLAALMDKALEQASAGEPADIQLRQGYRRAAAIVALARRRAGGKCEACKAEAPFVTVDGRPYLEVHHLTRVADGGPDHPDHVVAICPNCHREVHYGIEAETVANRLRAVRGIVSKT